MINIGIAGYGYWGPNLIRNFNGLPDALGVDDSGVVIVPADPAAAVEGDIVRVVGNPGADGRIAWLLVLATVPAGLVGALFESWIDERLGTPTIIAISLIGFGVLLWWADQGGSRDSDESTLTTGRALAIGCAQPPDRPSRPGDEADITRATSLMAAEQYLAVMASKGLDPDPMFQEYVDRSREVEDEAVSVRLRSEENLGAMPVRSFIERAKDDIRNRL